MIENKSNNSPLNASFFLPNSVRHVGTVHKAHYARAVFTSCFEWNMMDKS